MDVEMPRSVRVGALRYRVLLDAAEIKRASDAAELEPGGTWGAFSDHERLIIGLDPAHADDTNRHSLVHELLHCLLRQGGVWPNSYARLVDAARGHDEDIPVEEFTVSAMAGPLLSVLRDNPELLAWLTAS